MIEHRADIGALCWIFMTLQVKLILNIKYLIEIILAIML